MVTSRIDTMRDMNPWVYLPSSPPYVLPEDAEVFNNPKFKDEGYRFDAFPDPFVGTLDTASVVFLSLNPGFEPDDIYVNLSKPFFIEQSRKNLTHNSDVPFLYLADEMSDTHGYRWWNNLFSKSVREEPLSMKVIREKIMIIEYMPYHSVAYTPNRLLLPSQHYAFELVRKAMAKKKHIVIMRNVKAWLQAVPELDDYPYIRLNSQRPYITRSNMTKYNNQVAIDSLFKALK